MTEKERLLLARCQLYWAELELDCQPSETDLADLAEGGMPSRPMSWPCSYCGGTLLFAAVFAGHDCVPF